MRPFHPLFKNRHLATIAGNFWSRPDASLRWPTQEVIYQTEPGVRILVHAQKPEGPPRGELILIHGLEGSSNSGYIRSMSYAALERGYAVNRFNMRGCGESEPLSTTSYHAGQTSDLLAVAQRRVEESGAPVVLIGYSLGANVALKLAGELGERAKGLLAAVCSVSAPIDLAECAAAIERPGNIIYRRRFVQRLKARIERRHKLAPDVYTLEHLPKIRTVREFDDHYTARLFGFGTAANYFRTQSSNQFLKDIRVPTLLIQAEDDPMIPFEVYRHPSLNSNPHLRLVSQRHGGHLGFLARHRPRFWLDDTLLGWIGEQLNKQAPVHVS